MLAYLFSNRCPFFSVHDADRFIATFQNSDVTPEGLRHLGLFQAAKWLATNQDKWQDFKKSFPEEVKSITDHGGRVIFWNDADYPERLRSLFFPPALISCRGPIELLSKKTAAIVGSRSPTDLGRQWVRQAVRDLAPHDIVIVSGGARGIDAEAHVHTLEQGGHTVAYLPGCVVSPYPKSNWYFFDLMLKHRGLLVSEFFSCDEVRKESFHQRNRLIAGSSDVVVIVEAAERSGTLMTANKTLDENRELMVVPGSPLLANYSGSLELLCQGATLCRSGSDVLNRLEKKL